MKNLSQKLFKYRSYTPIPFLIVMLIFADSTPLTLGIGFIMAVIGEFFRFWGVSYAGSETRTTGNVGGTYLVISGPFAYVRNPLYLGNILLYLGIGIMSNALFPYLQVFALVFFYVQYKFIIDEEEKFLREKFQNHYDEFYNNVPRLLPQLKPFRAGDIKQPPFQIRAAFKSERRTLQAFFLVTLILLTLYIGF